MSTATTVSADRREPGLLGQTVVVIGGSAGIGLETARQARAVGAEVVLTGRSAERLEQAARAVGARSSAAFDANDRGSLDRFFDGLPEIDHVMVTAGNPNYGPMLEMEFEEARRVISERMLLALGVARNAAGKIRPGGALLFMGATGGVRPGLGIVPAIMAAMRALTASLALELAPARVNLIDAGFVDTPLSASLLGDGLDARRAELRATLPVRRVVEPADVAALAVHLMTNTALTGATYDVDGGQQLIG
jgi:NAD(P)-dependent dehydrogenase (short-subunit alcohol dehydrogenase family)